MDSTFDQRTRSDDDVVLDLKGLVRALVRRSPVILVVTALFAGAGLGASMLIPPTFRADTSILIENRDLQLPSRLQQQADRAVVDQETVASQVQLLTSRDLARRVAERNGLADHPEFAGEAGGLLDSVLVAVGLNRDPLRVSPEERVIGAFMERLKVYRVDGSRVVVVEFTSRDRVLSAAVANSVAEEYIALQGEAKRSSSADETRWLGEEIERLRGKVREAEEAVEAYRAGTDLHLGANNTTVARQQITDLTNAIAAARSDRATAESRATELEALIGRGVAAAADVIDSEAFRALRSREVALRGRMSELAVTLLPGHPQMQTIRSQIDDLEREQVAEARRVLETLRNEARVAEARIRSLSETLEEVKATSAVNNENEVELRALEREGAAQRDLLEGLLVRYREAVARQNAEVMPADARVISRAAVPSEPTFPQPGRLTLLAALAGFLISVAWVLSVEFVTGRALIRVAGTPQKPTALHPMATEVPADAPAPEPRVAQIRFALDATLSARPAARAGSGVDPAAVVDGPAVLYAALIADGQSRLAVMTVDDPSTLRPMIDALARTAVDDGTRVVVVDAVERNVGRHGPGLSDLISGEAGFGDVIRRNRRTRAHEIGVGTRPLVDGELAGDTLETILSALESAYDLVVVSLGDLQADDFAGRAPLAADRIVLVGRPEDPAVVRAWKALLDCGMVDVTVVPPTPGLGAAAA